MRISDWSSDVCSSDLRPRTPSLRRHVASGYLREGESLAALARQIGVPAAALEPTVQRFNGFAAAGCDGDFGTGGNLYDRGHGDPSVTPNPCLGPIAQPPFYAVSLLPPPAGPPLAPPPPPPPRVRAAPGAPESG